MISLPVFGAACSDEDQGAGSDVLGGDTAVVFDTGPDGANGDGLVTSDTGGASDSGATTGDSVATTADTTGDASGPCAEFGCRCTSNADCNSGLCVPGLDGLFCTATCVSTCPSEEFLCMTVALAGADPTNACVPLHPNLCKPCRADAECQNPLRPTATALCLPAADPDEGSFCGSSCADGIACPAGTLCTDVALDGGGVAKQCVPNDGLCDCRPAWASMSLVTDCAETNGLGSCGGTRTCGVDGLTACDAPEPVAETCNKADDDCNGTPDDIEALPCDNENEHGTCAGTTACDDDGVLVCEGRAPAAETCNAVNDDCDLTTDEDTCADALACTIDTCLTAGECGHAIAPGFCVIAGACVAENTPNPEFPCQRCVPDVSTTTWTGGGDEDGACFIGGECWPENAGKPGEPCLRCRSEVSTTTWSPAAAADNILCDDGLACTQNDRCNGSNCVGQSYTCGDDRACTDDVCQGDGTCRYPIKAGKCLIDGACWDDDQRADQTTCRVCDAATPTAWSAPTSALSCSDSNNCTRGDACSGFGCVGELFSCDDDKVCTADACLANGTCSNTLSAGFCLIDGACYAHGAPNPDNPCLVCNANLVATGWSLAPANTKCDDGAACTAGDTCAFGSCFGTAYSCAGLGCCVGDGTCTTDAPPGVVEDCAGGVDDDCDGLTDEGTPEQCGDVTDNDCDGDVDESANTWGEVFFARPYNDGGVAKVAIYTSNGDGTFQTRKLVQMPDDRSYSIVAIGDFDADKFLDLIVATPQVGSHTRCTSQAQCTTNQFCHGGICVDKCTVDQTQACPATLATRVGACPTGDECFDVDQYGDAGDRCLPHTEVYLVRERCPDGATELIELGILTRGGIVYPLLRPGEAIQTLVDANNDGQLDIVVRANWEVNTGHTLINQGEGILFGRIENTIKPRLCCGWANSLSGTPKDVDGDGVVDMVGWCNPNGGSSAAQFSWWKGMGDGFFGVDASGNFTGLSTAIPNAAAAPAGLMSTADFDRDGDIDIVNGLDDDGNPGAISMLVNRGSGGVLAWAAPYVVYDVTPAITSGSDSPGVGNGTSFDFDRDGYPDLLAGWTPQTLCALGTGFTCAWKEISLIRNLTGQPCGEGMSCNLTTDTCQACTPSCGAARCGDDGCGGSCGACPPAESCVAGQCVSKLDCVPQCDGKACGDNGCGGICGRCDPGSVCNAGACVANCTPQCTQANGQPKPCGDDGCGGQCIILGDKEMVVQDQSQSAYVVAPSNAPPRLDEALLGPAAPRDVDHLTCTPGNLYDLDRVELHYDWYRNGVFFAGAGDVPLLDARHTKIGELWHCVIRATDGTEWSIPRRSPTRTISN
ncbi:MAG: VCBS repeat-containing protein [Deltaproteobacteria bacterium]|nr:VCBS repeat-containing protein [Deltaproteobacteria bacterium]